MSHTVLLVEDDDELRESMRDLLEDSGYVVVTARDGQEALDALAHTPHPCVVLLDLVMSGMSGWDFLETMRARPEHSAVPVVVHSSAPSPAPAGATLVLKKPIPPERLLSVMRQYCAARPANDGTRRAVSTPTAARLNRRAGARAPDRTSSAFRSGLVRRPWRVLLVDDDADLREMCSEYLTTAGYDVLQAENGAVAIDVAIGRKPDVIVMDLEMPVMAGLEAMQRLGVDPRTRAIPVVVLSANGVLPQATAERLGCKVCLLKPCDPRDLEGILRTLVGEDAAATEARGATARRRT
jgi:CheY-like chemotaxis protein